MKKLLIATLFAGFTLSVQAADLPKECEKFLEYAVEAEKAQGGSEAEIKAGIEEMKKEFAAAIKQNGVKTVAKGCVALVEMAEEAKKNKGK